MARYVFDTSIISELRPDHPSLVAERMAAHLDDDLYLCEAVIYEIERGLLHRQASQQLAYFRQNVVPRFEVVKVSLNEWQLAAKLWAEMRRQGRQLSDVDLVLAAVTLQLGGVLVTDDSDFAALPVPQVNWRR